MELYERLRGLYCPMGEIYDAPDIAQKAFCEALGRFVLNDWHGFFLDPESRDGHCDPEAFITTIAGRCDAFFQLFNDDKVSSPIEQMLGSAMLWICGDWAGYPSVDFLDGPADHKKQFGNSEDLLFYITPQCKIAGHKVDFLAWFECKGNVEGVAIECDGHAFHERTKEQAARDKKRDRAIVTAGFPVVRFTGSEIYNDLFGCVDQVKDAIDQQLFRVSKAAGLIGGKDA